MQTGEDGLSFYSDNSNLSRIVDHSRPNREVAGADLKIFLSVQTSGRGKKKRSVSPIECYLFVLFLA